MYFVFALRRGMCSNRKEKNATISSRSGRLLLRKTNPTTEIDKRVRKKRKTGYGGPLVVPLVGDSRCAVCCCFSRGSKTKNQRFFSAQRKGRGMPRRCKDSDTMDNPQRTRRPSAERGRLARDRKLFQISANKHFCKESLKPFPSDDGDVLGAPRGSATVKEQEYLSSDHIIRTRTSTNCEMMRRPKRGLRNAASSFAHLHPFVRKGRMCPRAIEGIVSTEEWRKFLDACHVLKDEKLVVSPEYAETVIGNYLRFLATDVARKEALFRSVAMISSRAYLFAMHILEQMSLLSHKTEWRNKFEPSTLLGHAWSRDPDDASLLADFLAREIASPMRPPHPRAGTRDDPVATLLGFSDTESDGSPTRPPPKFPPPCGEAESCAAGKMENTDCLRSLSRDGSPHQRRGGNIRGLGANLSEGTTAVEGRGGAPKRDVGPRRKLRRGVRKGESAGRGTWPAAQTEDEATWSASPGSPRAEAFRRPRLVRRSPFAKTGRARGDQPASSDRKRRMHSDFSSPKDGQTPGATASGSRRGERRVQKKTRRGGRREIGRQDYAESEERGPAGGAPGAAPARFSSRRRPPAPRGLDEETKETTPAGDAVGAGPKPFSPRTRRGRSKSQEAVGGRRSRGKEPGRGSKARGSTTARAKATNRSSSGRSKEKARTRDWSTGRCSGRGGADDGSGNRKSRSSSSPTALDPRLARRKTEIPFARRTNSSNLGANETTPPGSTSGVRRQTEDAWSPGAGSGATWPDE